MDLLWVLLSNVVVVGVLIVAGWIARKWLAEYFANALRVEFETKLEAVRSDLRVREGQIAALSGSALSNMVAVQGASAQRRMKAADELWSAVNEWHSFIGAVSQLAMLKTDAVSDRIEKDTKLQNYFRTSMKEVPEDIRSVGRGAESTRPYLSDLAWALYKTYTAIFSTTAFHVTAFRNGIDPRPFITTGGVDEMLTKALPDKADEIAKAGRRIYGELAELLRDRILIELRKSIAGKEQDVDSVSRAAAIQELVEEVRRKQETKPIDVPASVKQ